MVSSKSKPESLFDVWGLYVSYLKANLSAERSRAKLAQTKTAIMRYTLPQWGFPFPQGNKLTEQEIEQAFELMKRIKPEQLQSALLVQHQLFEEQEVPEGIRRTYRAALNQLLVWCQGQEWFRAGLETEPQPLKPPRKVRQSTQDLRNPRDKLSKKNQQTASSYRYALGSVEGDKINPRLQRELEEFISFRLQPDLPTFRAVSSSTVEREVASIRQLLGWLYRVKEYDIETLSLNDIVPYIENASTEQADKVSDEVFGLAYGYMEWRRSRQKDCLEKFLTSNPDTSAFGTFLSVATFVYRKEITSEVKLPTRKHRQEIPLITSLRLHLKLWKRSQPKKEQKQAKPEEKAIDASLENSRESDPYSIELEFTGWNEILTIVETLRAECQPRLPLKNQTRKKTISLGPLRSLSAIAQSYQRFLLFALMSYMPPGRQQIYRNLLVDNGLSQTVGEASGVCYQKEKHWYLRLLGNKTRPEYSIEIPNLQYPEGRCFYQYLQEWLSEYSYEATSGGKTRINGLRQVLKPQHPYFFTKRTGERYLHPSDISHLVRDASYRLTQKVLNPDDFRTFFIAGVKQAITDNSSPSARKLRLQISDGHLDIYESRYPDVVEEAVRVAGEMAQNYITSAT